MGNDPWQIAKEVVEKVRSISFLAGRSEPQNLKTRIDDLVRTVTQEATKQAKANPNSEQHEINEAVRQKDNVVKMSNDMKHTVDRLHNAYELARNERHQLRKIENGQGLRRVFWRAASTASVAAVILFAWWFAHTNGIPLPLMRVPMPTPVP